MLELGTMLSGRYEVLKRVGSGGMADVYMAKDHKLNRNVAVKVLKSEYVEDEKFLKKFETEAQAVARLSHPNIVNRSEERRVGKECRSRWSPYH